MAASKISERLDELDLNFRDVIVREFPLAENLYLNTGSCGRKPLSVLTAIQSAWEKLNTNPTIMTFLDEEPVSAARAAAAKLFDVPTSSLLLTQNTTQGLQLVLTNLLGNGDELVTTDKEHGSVNTLSRYLAETRAVVTRRYPVDPFEGSKKFCEGVMNLVTDKTKVILISQIGSYNTWRPDLGALQDAIKGSRIELVVDGAHAPGQGLCRPGNFRIWVSSGHKWLGGPNGTGFVILPPDLVPTMQPVNLGDLYFNKRDSDPYDITRFESMGTSDVVRWDGLSRACKLQMELDPVVLGEKQVLLAEYFRSEVEALNPKFRTPNLFKTAPAEATSMLACYWPAEKLRVDDLRQSLWERFKIWVQPDFGGERPGLGLRVSCHYSTVRNEIDQLLVALKTLIKA